MPAAATTKRRLRLWQVWALLLLGSWILFAVLVWAASQALAGATVLLDIIERALSG